MIFRLSHIKVKMGPFPMRVLHLLDSLSNGGTEWNAVRTVLALNQAGVDARLAVFRDGPLRAELEAAGVAIVPLVLRSFYSPDFVREAKRVGRLIASTRITILHAHDRYTNAFGAGIKLLGARVPLIVSKRWDSRSDPSPMRAAAWVASRAAGRVLANCEAAGKASMVQDRVRADKVRIVPNFVDDTLLSSDTRTLRESVRIKFGIPMDAPVLVCVANLRPVKGHETLLTAVKVALPMIPGLILVLAGDGPSFESLKRTTASLGLNENVRFLGSQDGAWQVHAAADISVLASHSEGLPNALLEAQALGVPVVATAVGGVAEVVTDGVSGLLLPPGDTTALGHALASLLRDPVRRQAMGVAARAEVEARYSRSVVMAKLLDLYNELSPHIWTPSGGARQALSGGS